MTFDLDSMTWTCHVCGDERPDRFISVFKAKHMVGAVEVQTNIRYCNDRPECAGGAPEVADKLWGKS